MTLGVFVTDQIYQGEEFSAGDLLIGDNYRLDPHVIGVAASAAALTGMTSGLGHTLGLTVYQHRELGIIVTGFVLQGLVCWLLIPELGQMGGAVASMSTAIFIWLARLWTIYRRFGIVPVSATALIPFILACVLAFVVYHTTSGFDRTLVSTAFSCILSGGGYLLLMIGFRGLRPRAGLFATE